MPQAGCWRYGGWIPNCNSTHSAKDHPAGINGGANLPAWKFCRSGLKSNRPPKMRARHGHLGHAPFPSCRLLFRFRFGPGRGFSCRRQRGERSLLLERSQEHTVVVYLFVQPDQLPAIRLIDDCGEIHRVSGNGYAELQGVAPRVDRIRRCGSRERRGVRPVLSGGVEDDERIAEQAGASGQDATVNLSLPNKVEFPTKSCQARVVVILHSKSIGACKAGG